MNNEAQFHDCKGKMTDTPAADKAEHVHAEKVELADVAPAYDKALERRVVRKLDMNVTALITFLCAWLLPLELRL